MAAFVVLHDFEDAPPSTIRFRSGEVLEDTRLGKPLAMLLSAGLAVLPETPGRLSAAALHRAYRGSHPTTTGAHLLGLLAAAGEL